MNVKTDQWGVSRASLEKATRTEVMNAIRDDPDGWGRDFGKVIHEDHTAHGDHSLAELISASNAWVAAKAPSGARIDGIRDQIHCGHPSEERMARFGCNPARFPCRSWRGTALPMTKRQIRRAIVARWGPLSAPSCKRMMLYRGNMAYDANWSSDDLMLQVIFVSLGEFVAILQLFFALDPTLFHAAWERDIDGLVPLLQQYAEDIENHLQIDSGRLCRIGAHFKKQAKLTLDAGNAALQLPTAIAGVLVFICQFYELERCFELIEAVTGSGNITEVTLAASLATQLDMNREILSGSRLGEVLAGSMLHYLPLAQGAATKGFGHLPQSVHVALAPGGKPSLLDIVAGSQSKAAYDAVCREYTSLWSQTIGLKKGLASAGFTAPAHFVNGMEPLRMIFSMVLMLNQRLPKMRGHSAPSKRPAGYHQDNSFGRLALIILANIDPALAQLVLNKSIATQKVRACIHWPAPLDGLVSNPNLWASLGHPKTGHRPASDQEDVSLSFGSNVCVENVKQARNRLNEYIAIDLGKPGGCQGFYGDAWLHERSFKTTLVASVDPARSKIVAGATSRMPRHLRKFGKQAWHRLVDIASIIHAGKTPMAEDPARRTPEYRAACYGSLASFAVCGISTVTSPIAYKVASDARLGVTAVPPVAQGVSGIERKLRNQAKRWASRGYK
jgi:hypothetical protein